MSGALMELVAIGAQDNYLTESPEITFFQTHHKKYTNFAIESKEETFNGTTGFGRSFEATISRSGDLLWRMWLHLHLPKLERSMFLATTDHVGCNSMAWCNSVGHAAISSVGFMIGGGVIDKHLGKWLNIWDELTGKEEHRKGMSEMIGRLDSESDRGLVGNADAAKTVFVPLQFWFNRNVGAALPMVALQYHEVKVRVNLEPLNKLVVYLNNDGDRYVPGAGEPTLSTSQAPSAPDLAGCNLFIDFIYLDTEERQRFAQNEHFYLIEQVQTQEEGEKFNFGSKAKTNIKLNLNHPVKEIIWTVQNSLNYAEGPSYNDWFNYSTNSPGSANPNLSKDLMSTALLSLNSHPRFTEARSAQYFRLVQPATHHTRIPNKQIYVYSFAISPEEYQPSGTCNFSRIDHASLEINTEGHSSLPNPATVFGAAYTNWSQISGRIDIYAHSLNILKIRGGLGGLLYAN